MTLLTDGQEIYARTAGGEFINLLRAPDQPMLVVGSDLPLRELTAKTSQRRGKKRPRAVKEERPAKARSPKPGA